MQLLIRDETASGSITNELTLDLLDETITVRELIRSRVYQEVQDHNLKSGQAHGTFKGLVQPSELESQLNGPRKSPTLRQIDWKKQFAKACEAFERNGFFILVNDRQAEELDESIPLHHDSRISFVKLTPLVGG